MIGKFIVFQHLPYFFIGKSEILVKLYICNGKNFQIIQSCKNTFPGNAHTSSQHRKFQAVICLKRILKQVADKDNHLIIIFPFKCFCQWNIIFIDQNNYFFPIMLFKKFGKHF